MFLGKKENSQGSEHNDEQVEKKKRLGSYRKWALIITAVISPIMGGAVYLAFHKVLGIIKPSEAMGFMEPLQYGKTWVTILILGGIIWGGLSLWIVFKWKVKDFKKDKKPIDKNKGDARFQEPFEVLLKATPMFESELNVHSVDGVVISHKWVKKEAVAEIKSLLITLRAYMGEGVKLTRNDLDKTLSLLESNPVKQDVKKLGLDSKVVEVKKLLAEEKLSTARKELDGILKVLNSKEVWIEKLQWLKSEEIQASAREENLEKELEKVLAEYEATKDLRLIERFYTEYKERLTTSGSKEQIEAKAHEFLEKEKLSKEERAKLTDLLENGELVELEAFVSELSIKKVTQSDSKEFKLGKDKKMNIELFAKKLAEKILKNEVKVEYTADGKGVKRPSTTDVELLYYVQNNGLHSAIVGSTGSGKTVAVIKPTIDVFAMSGNKPSMVISDVKGELFAQKSSFLQKMGYDVYALNFNNNKNSSKWNPLTIAVDYWTEAIEAGLRGEISLVGELEDKAETSLNELKASIFAPKGKEDPFWTNAAGKALLGLIWFLFEEYKKDYLSHKEALKADPNAQMPESAITSKKINLAHVNKLAIWLTAPTAKGKEDNWFSYFYDSISEDEKGSRKSYQFLSDVINGAENTSKSIVATFTERMLPFEQGVVMGITSESNIPFDELGKRPVAIFMVIPDEKESYNFFGTLFVSQVYQKLVDTARANGGSNSKTTYFLLDEFGNFPKINQFATIITVARSRGVRFSLVLQDFAQLDNIYGKDTATTLKGNLDQTIYLLTTDENTAKQISSKIGNTTTERQSVSTSSGKDGKPHTSTSTSTESVPLIRPEQLLRMKFLKGILLGAREFPMQIRFIPYFFDPQAKARENLGEVVLENTSVSSETWSKKHAVSFVKYIKDRSKEEKENKDVETTWINSISEMASAEGFNFDTEARTNKQKKEILKRFEEFKDSKSRAEAIKVLSSAGVTEVTEYKSTGKSGVEAQTLLLEEASTTSLTIAAKRVIRETQPSQAQQIEHVETEVDQVPDIQVNNQNMEDFMKLDPNQFIYGDDPVVSFKEPSNENFVQAEEVKQDVKHPSAREDRARALAETEVNKTIAKDRAIHASKKNKKGGN